MIEIIEGLPNNVVGIAVRGRVTKQDCYDVLMPAMEESLKRHNNFQALLRAQFAISGRRVGRSQRRDRVCSAVRAGRPR